MHFSGITVGVRCSSISACRGCGKLVILQIGRHQISSHLMSLVATGLILMRFDENMLKVWWPLMQATGIE